MINKVIIEGWTNSLQERRTQDGKPVITGTISTPRNKDEATGKWTYDYINFTAYDEEASLLQTIGDKQKVIIVGRWRHDSVKDETTGSWKNYDKAIVEAVACENLYPVLNTETPQETATEPSFTLDIRSDDLPF